MQIVGRTSSQLPSPSLTSSKRRPQRLRGGDEVSWINVGCRGNVRAGGSEISGKCRVLVRICHSVGNDVATLSSGDFPSTICKGCVRRIRCVSLLGDPIGLKGVGQGTRSGSGHESVSVYHCYSRRGCEERHQWHALEPCDIFKGGSFLLVISFAGPFKCPLMSKGSNDTELTCGK